MGQVPRDDIPPYHQLQDYRNGQLDPAAGEQYFHKYVVSYTQRFKRAKLRYMGSKESDAEALSTECSHWQEYEEDGATGGCSVAIVFTD